MDARRPDVRAADAMTQGRMHRERLADLPRSGRFLDGHTGDRFQSHRHDRGCARWRQPAHCVAHSRRTGPARHRANLSRPYQLAFRRHGRGAYFGDHRALRRDRRHIPAGDGGKRQALPVAADRSGRAVVRAVAERDDSDPSRTDHCSRGPRIGRRHCFAAHSHRYSQQCGGTADARRRPGHVSRRQFHRHDVRRVPQVRESRRPAVHRHGRSVAAAHHARHMGVVRLVPKRADMQDWKGRFMRRCLLWCSR